MAIFKKYIVNLPNLKSLISSLKIKIMDNGKDGRMFTPYCQKNSYSQTTQFISISKMVH